MSTDPDCSQVQPAPEALPLAADPARQAVGAIGGFIYQFWWSIDAWLQLKSEDEVIFLEGAEDLDWVSPDAATTLQVKHEADSISLNTQRAHKVLESFWALVGRELPGRQVSYHYLSTARAALEQDATFGGHSGIDAWRIARTDLSMAATIGAYLVAKLDPKSPLRAFLSGASPQQMQDDLIRRFHWFLNQPGIQGVIESVEDRLSVRLSQNGGPLPDLQRVKDRLLGHVSEVILRPDLGRRRLTLGGLIREIEAATNTQLSVLPSQMQQLAAMLARQGEDPNVALLRSLAQPIPESPVRLLPRATLVNQIRELMAARRTVLLTGSVFKGKTTLAQLVATEVCPAACWFSVASMGDMGTTNLLHALATTIERPSTPALVVIDDINLSATAQRAYKQALALLVGRASRAGRGLILTARGTPSATALVLSVGGIDVIDVPEMSAQEVQSHCEANGCPASLSSVWGPLLRAATLGHPKLIQIRINDLQSQGWPAPDSSSFFKDSAGTVDARGIARNLLRGSTTDEIAEFIYIASEATFPLTRTMLMRIAAYVGRISNAGDVIDELTGSWLELVASHRARVTPLLKGSAADVWLPERRNLAHQQLYDAIAGDRNLDGAEAASLLFHAYFAADGHRLFRILRLLEGSEIRANSDAVYPYITWVPYIALASGEQFFADDLTINALLRQLQFSVAAKIDAAKLPAIVERWIEDAEVIPIEEIRNEYQAMLWHSIASAQSLEIPLRTKLNAIYRLRSLTGQTADIARSNTLRALEEARPSLGDIPADATGSQFVLSLQSIAVKRLEDLSSLLDWLEHDSSPEARADFEAVLNWPVVSSSGGYVHGAWSGRYDTETDWIPTLQVLERAGELARRFGLTRFGSEVAKAASIVYGEHANDSDAALRVLDEAVAAFGENVVLQEQRCNVLFQRGDDESMLEAWRLLASDPLASPDLDIYAFRRAGISASRRSRWGEAARYFLAGREATPQLPLEVNRFGLSIDAAYVTALGGDLQGAARTLAEATMHLPSAAWEDADSWESVLRILSKVARCIDQLVTAPSLQVLPALFGRASEPGLKLTSAQGDQLTRTTLTVASVGLLAAQLGSLPAEFPPRFADQPAASGFVRYQLARTNLAIEFHRGTTAEFISLVSDFDHAWTVMGDELSVEQTGDSSAAKPSTRMIESGWFPILIAAAICCPTLQDALPVWHSATEKRWGRESQTAADIHGISKGVAITVDDARQIVQQRNVTRGEFAGALLKLLRDSTLRPENVYFIQQQLAGLMMSHCQGTMLQPYFARPVARRFALAWKPICTNLSFLLVAPRLNVSKLLDAIELVERGTGSMKHLLSAAASAVGAKLDDGLSLLE
ncbi:MAG: hypothetical protein AMXMBFR59_18870 [Rhodanobacteraceae bacterium]